MGYISLADTCRSVWCGGRSYGRVADPKVVVCGSNALCDEPFMLLEKGAKAEISEIFERNNLTPNVKFTTWDDYAVMSMVESGLGIAILPELILKRVPYRIIAKELDVPAYRNIGLALRDKKTASLAVKRFIDYLQYR